ncbi:protein JTB-like [Urocitellus parryii]
MGRFTVLSRNRPSASAFRQARGPTRRSSCPDSRAEASVREEKQSVSTSTLPCWLGEEFMVAEECTPCSSFQAKTIPECGSTGYVEKITCSSSKRNEFKSCSSALMEQHLFWKFEGAVVGVALVFACLVIIRQRQLDRKALEKVRKQIESI